MDQKSAQSLVDGAPEVLLKPKVQILAYTRLDPAGAASLMLEHDKCFTIEACDGEHLIEYGGRNCYQSWHNPAGRSTDEYIGNIIRQQHYSVLEHTNVTFDIQAVSRAFTHELVRHRHLSFSQLSQRYVDSRSAAFVCPPLFLQDPTLIRHWLEIVKRQQEDLVALERSVVLRHPELPQKVVREAVRSVAPNAIETKIVVTGNLRAWRDYLSKRWSSHADLEIQEVSHRIAGALKVLYPSVFKDVVYEK